MEDPSNNSTLPLSQDSSVDRSGDHPPSLEQPLHHGSQTTTPNSENQINTHYQEAAHVMPYQQPLNIPCSQTLPSSDLSSQTGTTYQAPEQPPEVPPYAAPPYDTLYSAPYPAQQAGDPGYIPPKVDPSDPPPPYPGPPNAVHYEAHMLPISPPGTHSVTTTTITSHQPSTQSSGAGNQRPGQPPANVTIVRTVQENGREIESHMVLSFFSVFCCFCFGIIALLKSSSVSSLVAQGRYAEARRASNQAKTWATVAIVFGLINAGTNIIRLMISD